MKEDEERENASAEEEESTNGKTWSREEIAACWMCVNVCRSGDRRWRRMALYIDSVIMGHLQHTNSVNNSREVKHTHITI